MVFNESYKTLKAVSKTSRIGIFQRVSRKFPLTGNYSNYFSHWSQFGKHHFCNNEKRSQFELKWNKIYFERMSKKLCGKSFHFAMIRISSSSYDYILKLVPPTSVFAANYSKSQVFVQKFNFEKTTIFREIKARNN